MGWKALKDHYKIKNIVQVRNGAICIGNAHIPDVIIITESGPKWSDRRVPTGYPDLRGYFSDIVADLSVMQDLMNMPDRFDNSLPVFTYIDADVIELRCESYGWPNCTHDGQCMYDNKFFESRISAISACKKDAKNRLDRILDHISTLENELKSARELLQKDQLNYSLANALS